MLFKGPHNEQYNTGREIGRGGEGTVYEVQNVNDIVLKKYNEPLTVQQVNKLRHMVALRSYEIEAYAAWPTGLVLDDNDRVCGFVMKKLSGFVPLHMIFSPMDRKKMFPDKGYNFLVHVARNLATAFHKLHEAGLVVGDVNEGNILINAAGLVSFIDCDSFQVKGEAEHYFCEVGVPRYTPPELLKAGSFVQVVRTVNTDSFSLAVLIFQLLFLGRHPFAGKNKTNKDIDEETAIREHEFAYSLDRRQKKLSPPNDSFAITNLSDSLVALFHMAFDQESRPVPAEWVKALDNQLGDMVTCEVSRLHAYPSKLAECPWCKFRKERGILYFLDDSYINAYTALGDIESFVQGFQLDKLEIKPWSGNLTHPQLVATPIDSKSKTNKTLQLVATGLGLILGIVAVVDAGFNPAYIVAGIVVCLFFYKFSPWVGRLKAEVSRLAVNHKQLNDKLTAMIRDYNQTADHSAYTRGIAGLDNLVQQFRDLPKEFDKRRALMEERLYNEQLLQYLYLFKIEDHTIPAIGDVRKAALIASGVVTAADIGKVMTQVKVPGIGAKNQQILLSWQRQMASGFVYIPDNYALATGLDDVNKEIANLKHQLELSIRKEYQSLNYLKMNISNKTMVLNKQISDLSIKTAQAELDLKTFRKWASVGD